ncbi:hypothetical protein IMG5_145820 [Ichthyophthirius multifiliis]|uniref:Thioredoxin domain-containing protein n=1 Tax=Ichthyophthirius multifiliis TaxID=5932 RepID=G0QXX5_ICHMU|nr:hypothetical protein IMG5_145820 [Ichthyophthirius multifiliis]EGR29927.1 hypothetical protein IMG5_145820 [Ichthyophthirius multifiliis]|eukprot:XP_004031163.1 hypothetical protein IMG5_145820 [Ichthyophthirius multifiliis]
MQFVEFYRTSDSKCIDLRGFWGSFADKYTTQDFNFYCIEVDRNKKIVEQYNINIDVNSMDLPTVILFEDGAEFINEYVQKRMSYIINFLTCLL